MNNKLIFFLTTDLFWEKIFRNALGYQRVDELEDGEDEILESEDLTVGVDSLWNIEKLLTKN